MLTTRKVGFGKSPPNHYSLARPKSVDLENIYYDYHDARGKIKYVKDSISERAQISPEGETEKRADNWLKLTEQTFDFACYAHKAFLFGDAQTKREILSTIVGLNCTMKNHILNITAVEWLVPIKEKYPAIEARIKAFEPQKYCSLLPGWC